MPGSPPFASRYSRWHSSLSALATMSWPPRPDRSATELTPRASCPNRASQTSRPATLPGPGLDLTPGATPTSVSSAAGYLREDEQLIIRLHRWRFTTVDELGLNRSPE